MPPVCDIIIVHCGGNDLGRLHSPEELANIYINKFEGTAKVVVFCSVVRRLDSSPNVNPDFKHLAQKFNSHLNLCTTHYSNLHYYFHDPRLQSPSNIHSDGVHLSQRGLHRFYHSTNRALKLGLRHLYSITPNSNLRTTGN